MWKGHFYNEVHRTHNFLNDIEVHSPPLDPGIYMKVKIQILQNVYSLFRTLVYQYSIARTCFFLSLIILYVTFYICNFDVYYYFLKGSEITNSSQFVMNS